MKKLRKISLFVLLLAMFVPTTVGAATKYYADSFSMHHYYDTQSTVVTASNQRYMNAHVSAQNSGGARTTYRCYPGKTATTAVMYTKTHWHDHWATK